MDYLFSMKAKQLINILLVFLFAAAIGILSLNLKAIIVIYALFFIGMICLFVAKRPDRFVYFLMLFILLQNFIAILLAKFVGSSFSSGFIILKDVITYVALLLVCIYNFRKAKNTLTDTSALLGVICLIIYLIIPTDVSVLAKFVQFRQLLTPIALYLLGRFMYIKRDRADIFLKYFVHISIIAVIFGLIERFFLGDSFWENIGMGEYMVSKGMESWAYANGGLPGNFYSYDFTSFIGISLRRMVSFIADPTLFGQFLVFPLAILIFTNLFRGKQKGIYLFILLVGLLLTISKGGLLSFSIVLLFRIFRSKYRPLAFILMVFLAIFLTGILLNAEKFSSLPNHLRGLTNNLSLVIEKPMGLGLGKAGNFAALYAKGSDEEVGGGESYIGMIVGQLGIFSVPILIFFIKIVNIFRRNRDNIEYVHQFSNLLAATLIGTICSSMISESAISFISTGIVFLMSGIFVTIKTNYQFKTTD